MIFVVVDYACSVDNSIAQGTQNVFIEMDNEPFYEEWDEFERRVSDTVKEYHGADSVNIVIINYKKMRDDKDEQDEEYDNLEKLNRRFNNNDHIQIKKMRNTE